MPEIILGLDVGTDTVKAVLAALRGRTVTRIFAAETVRFDENVELDAALKKIADTLLPLLPEHLRCVVSISPSQVMFRHVRLPFRDDAKIKKTLFFELEPLLPVPVEEVVADYVQLPDEGLLTAVCAKDRVRQVISAVETHLGSVLVIDIAASVLALPLLEQKSLTGCGMILDIGASSTCAVFYEKNALIQIRSFSFGGDVVTRVLADERHCSLQDAEQVKITDANAAKTGGTVEACRKFCLSLANTLEYMKLNDIFQSVPDRILLTGGGSLFSPLREELIRQIGIPVSDLDLGSSGQMQMEEKIRERYVSPVMNTALASVKRAFLSRKSFNFRQGEFAYRSVSISFKKLLIRGGMIAGILVLLAAADIFLSYQWQASRAADLKKQISIIFKKHYPSAAIMADPVQQLRTKLADDRKMYGLDSGTSGVTALEALRDLSGFIPSGLDVLITSVHYEGGKMLLKGEAKKIDDVTSVKNGLLKSKYFKNVAIGSTALSKEGDKVNFDLRIDM
ncbi:MAG: pilus assembly protein PilM [Syntrophaceae bacterium]|jgi:general secretion pathway protein L|nr:pilus assembly protein PilM [Syntrophaceae bacterium]